MKTYVDTFANATGQGPKAERVTTLSRPYEIDELRLVVDKTLRRRALKVKNAARWRKSKDSEARAV